LVRIGANRGCERSFATVSTAFATGRRALFARAGGVTFVVFLVKLCPPFTGPHLRQRIDLYTKPARLHSTTERS
jgi:hypothetical protein